MEVLIEIDGIELNVKGEYFPEEVEVGLPNVFEIEKIELYKGELWDLLEWVSSINSDYIKIIEEKILEKIKNK